MLLWSLFGDVTLLFYGNLWLHRVGMTSRTQDGPLFCETGSNRKACCDFFRMLKGVNHLLFGPQSHNVMREGLESAVIAISLGQKEEKKGDCELVLTTGDGGNKYRWDLGVDLNSEKPLEATEIVYSSFFLFIWNFVL